MKLRNQGVLTAVFYWAIFNNLDPGIAGNPVFRINPTPQWEGTADALISYKSTNRTVCNALTASLDTFLKAYRLPGLRPGRSQNIYNCDYIRPPPSWAVCDVDVRGFGSCITENLFGYHRASPCVFLTLDTPLGWLPEYYNDTNSLPANMPADLKSHITDLASTNPRALNTVWISCEGVYPADLEFIGPIKYVPTRGMPGYYFMNNNLPGYLSPIVALQFERPSSGVLINVQCKAWARNIDLNDDSVLQSGRFSLMID